MKKKGFLTALLLCLSLLGGANLSSAQESRKAAQDNDVLTQLLNEGWHIVKVGVLQRELRAGEVESFVFGPEGFTWKLQDLRQRLQKMQDEFRRQPTPELQKAIAGFRAEIASTRKMIERARAAEASGDTSIDKVSCSINFSYDASASYGTSVQGTWGNASATFTGTCGFTGEVYATAYSKVTVSGGATTKTVTDGPRSGANVSASAYSSLNGGPTCESSAYASMTSSSLNPSSYTMSASNPSSCPPVATPLSVSVTHDAYANIIDLYDSDCIYITWTTNISGGTAPYTSTMYVNSASQGVRTSYSANYCNVGTNSSRTVAVSATVTDSGSQSKSASAPTVTIRSHAVFTGGCYTSSVDGQVVCP